MEYFAGLDVSLRSCAICVVDAKGNVVLKKDLPCEVDVISDCLNSCGQQIARIGFEAGTLSQHLFSGLTSEGFDVVCVEARKVNGALSAMRNKTDKNDARGIAQGLHSKSDHPLVMTNRDPIHKMGTERCIAVAPLQATFLMAGVEIFATF